MVTVWATEQDNMAKVAKWKPITTPGGIALQHPSKAGAAGSNSQPKDSRNAAADGGSTTARGVCSGDYFVPWHLPLHRAEAAAAAAAAAAAGPSNREPRAAASQDIASTPARTIGSSSRVDQQSCNSLAGAAATPPAAPGARVGGAPQVDSSKGAVVYQRYYHLFERGELDALVTRLPEARLADSFYDKDNWCVVMERV